MINSKHIHKKSGVILNWLFSYLIILFIPILIIGIANIATINVVESEINKSNSFLLKRVQTSIDGLMENVEQLSNQISLNSNVQNILTYGSSLNNNNYYYSIYKIKEDLKRYKNSYSFLDDYYVYFKNMGTIVSPNGSTDEETFYRSYYEGNNNFSYEKWHETNQKYYMQKYTLLNDQKGKNKILLYGCSLPLLEKSDFGANVLIKLDEAQFAQQINNVNLVDTNVILIIDENNNVIYSSNKTVDSGSFQYMDFSKKSDSIHKKIAGQEFFVSYITSKKFNWKYVSIIPYNVFWERAQYIKKYALISLILCLAIGGFVTFFLLKRNYNPLGRLIKNFEELSSSVFRADKDEYSFIENVLSNIMNDKKRIENRLQSQNDALRDGMINRLIKGNIKKDYITEEYLSTFNIHFTTEFFLVVLLYIDDVSEEYLKDGINNFNIINFILKNEIEKALKDYCHIYVTEIDDMSACLINLRDRPLDTTVRDILGRLCEKQDYINKNYRIWFSCAVSSIHSGIYEIAESYHESVDTMDYKLVMGIAENLSYPDIEKSPESDDVKNPFKNESGFINLVKAGQMEAAEALLNEFFDSCAAKKRFSLEMSKCFKMNMMSTLNKIINDMDHIGSNEYIDLLSRIEQLMECKNKNDIKAKILYIIRCIGKYANHRTIRQAKIDHKITEYITQNYTMPELNISTIAEHFDMHPVYISQVFREQTGEGILDYIHKIRIERAKEILKCLDTTLDKAAKEVGYSNVRTFIRAFKKYEGINPGSYKEISVQHSPLPKEPPLQPRRV